MTQATKAADAIKKLDDSALVAQERIQAAAEKAQKMIDDACNAATKALEDSSRIPDKRNIDGSYQWDRGDRYRRGSDERIQRLEDKIEGVNKGLGDKINGVNKAEGLLEVGQATRAEQISGLVADVGVVSKECEQLRTDFDTMEKEVTSRMTTMRELMVEVKDACVLKIDALKDDTRKDKIKTQQYVIGIVVGFIVTVVLALLFTTVHIH
jgi:hypothetical protein